LTVVTIKGTDFTRATGVTIGGEPAQDFKIADDRKTITATAPMNFPGIVDVVVQMPTGDLTGSRFFTYYSQGKLPPLCQPQASSRKKIIALVDDSLGALIDDGLFEVRQLINQIEAARRKLKGGINTPDGAELNALVQKVKAMEDALLPLQLDPPIDSISHQVQFIIAYSANISPTWTLVRFKGPSPGSGSLAGVTKTLTHTLNIGVGPPGSLDVANTINALQIGTSIGNAIGVNAAAGLLGVP
jgi:hypothetical protein